MACAGWQILPLLQTLRIHETRRNCELPKIAQVGQDLQNSRVGKPDQYIGLVIQLFLRGLHQLVEELQRYIIKLEYVPADKLDLENLRSLFVPNLRYSRRPASGSVHAESASFRSS